MNKVIKLSGIENLKDAVGECFGIGLILKKYVFVMFREKDKETVKVLEIVPDIKWYSPQISIKDYELKDFKDLYKITFESFISKLKKIEDRTITGKRWYTEL